MDQGDQTAVTHDDIVGAPSPGSALSKPLEKVYRLALTDEVRRSTPQFIVDFAEVILNAIAHKPCRTAYCFRCNILGKVKRYADRRGLTPELLLQVDSTRLLNIALECFDPTDTIRAVQKREEYHRQKAEEARAQTERLQRELTEARRERPSLAPAQQVPASTARIQELEGLLQQAEAELQRQRDAHAKELAQRDEVLTAKEADIDSLLGMPTDTSIDPAVQAKIDGYDGLTQELERLRTAAESDLATIDDLRAQLAERVAELTEAAKIVAERDRLLKRLETAEDIFQELRSGKEGAEADRDAARTRAERAERDLHEARTQGASSAQLIAEHRLLAVGHDERAWRAESELADVTQRYLALRTEAGHTTARLGELERDHAALQAEAEGLRRTNVELREQAGDSDARAQADRVLQALEQAREQFGQMLRPPPSPPAAVEPVAEATPTIPAPTTPTVDEELVEAALEHHQERWEDVVHTAAGLGAEIAEKKRAIQLIEHRRDHQCSSDGERGAAQTEIDAAQAELQPLLERQQSLREQDAFLQRRASELRRFLDALKRVKAGLPEGALTGDILEEIRAAKEAEAERARAAETTPKGAVANWDQLQALAQEHGLTVHGLIAATLLQLRPQPRQHAGIDRLFRAARTIGLLDRLGLRAEDDGTPPNDWQGSRRPQKTFEIYVETGPNMPGQTEATLYRRSNEPLTWKPEDVLTSEERAAFVNAYNAAKAAKPEWLQNRETKT